MALKIQIFYLHIDFPTRPSHSCLLAFQRGKLPFLHSLKPWVCIFRCRLAIFRHKLRSCSWHYTKSVYSVNSDFPDNLLKWQRGLYVRSGYPLWSISLLSLRNNEAFTYPLHNGPYSISQSCPKSNYLKHPVWDGEKHWKKEKQHEGKINNTVFLQTLSTYSHRILPLQK